jgi:hypothetical protein
MGGTKLGSVLPVVRDLSETMTGSELIIFTIFLQSHPDTDIYLPDEPSPAQASSSESNQ